MLTLFIATAAALAADRFDYTFVARLFDRFGDLLEFFLSHDGAACRFEDILHPKSLVRVAILDTSLANFAAPPWQTDIFADQDPFRDGLFFHLGHQSTDFLELSTAALAAACSTGWFRGRWLGARDLEQDQRQSDRCEQDRECRSRSHRRCSDVERAVSDV